MVTQYLPLEHFQATDHDRSSARIRDIPYGKERYVLEIYQDEVIFGNTLVNHVSPAEAILLSNAGYDDVPISKIEVVGDFIFNGPSITKILIGETVGLNVAFKPLIEGERTGGLYVTAPDSVGTKFISFSGSGVLMGDGLMQYPLLKAGNVTSGQVAISNGVYSYAVSGIFDGAVAQLQWRVGDSAEWISIPGVSRTFADTIYGIPLNTGQARVLITKATAKTSLTVIIMW